ncbi:hypothetical protein [Mucilaginibacter aquatilis]|uniref:Lipoprotein n=1 Tax=Mucilaginibacter aquatilis TaxID=1517760 RepID=A0A6I4I8C0_9SPHI|nr:hypothetical protein [Mucilaginibacter aquatilis]MVN91371.1 hypothetical protein [Mucilaginibacter aquatilis]
MKNSLLAILIIIFSTGCNRSKKNQASVYLKSDTVVLSKDEVVFISPSDNSIESLKKKHGDDFYTIADDANNYFAEAANYLDSLKVSYKNFDDNKVIVFNQNNKVIQIPRHTSPWYVIFYKNGKYETLDMINVQEDYPKFFNDKSPVDHDNLNVKHIIDSIAKKKYYVVEEQECDINTDGYDDKIIVFGYNGDINTQDPATKIAPVALLINEQNKRYKVLVNGNIYPNNFGDAFKKLAVKNNFFTIELLNEIPDQYLSEKFITFTFNETTKEVVLSKYGENINWSDGRKDEIRCSDSDFGKILYKEYDSNTIKAKCSK